MLTCFPDPYPDEIFYSICARYGERMKYATKSAAARDLFGEQFVGATIALPGRLATLVANLPPAHCYSVDKLIDDHTLFPLFRPFLPKDRIPSIRDDMKGKKGSVAYTRAGLTVCRIPLPRAEDLRFCPACVNEDRNRWGECYWHRVHQAPGVEVCPIHRTILHRIDKNALRSGYETDFIAAESIAHPPSPTEVDTSDFCQVTLLNIAADIAWIMNQHDLFCDPAFFEQKYSMLLTDRSLVNRSSHWKFDIPMLLREFKAYYPAQLLQMLSCELGEHIKNNWLYRLIYNKDHRTHPLYHLLLIHFLGYHFETFVRLSSLRNPILPRPFGDGPWPCLNSASPHYRQRIIHHCSISASTDRRPKGVFSCKCGFVYSRIGPDTCEDDSFKLDKVLIVGYVWEEAFIKLWEDPTVGMVEIPRRLRLNRNALLCQAARLGLSFPRPGGRLLQPSKKLQIHLNGGPVNKQERESYRILWISAMQDNPGIGVSSLQKKYPKAYKWLYEHDREWQKAHLPQRPKSKQARRSTINWNERDKQAADAVIDIALRMKSSNDVPEHVSRAAILRRLEKGVSLKLYLRQGKFPLTARMLDSVVEPFEEFVIRRIKWMRDRYIQEERELPARYLFAMQAGVAYSKASLKVKEVFDDAMQSLEAFFLPRMHDRQILLKDNKNSVDSED